MMVAFRVDASLQMGTGHVMRCLTLADALVVRGATCVFICREHPGNLLELIRSNGHAVHALPLAPVTEANSLELVAVGHEQALAHTRWLGAAQEEDAEACVHILAKLQPDWLIVDHYGLDARWELLLKPYYRRLMVIDDLADRAHACNLLLDQTFGRDTQDYQSWVPSNCQVLCGSQYALLRPEFAALRAYGLLRRSKPQLRQLLVTMGGVDKDNVTGQVLTALRFCPVPADCQVTVAMGVTAPWLPEVEQLARNLPWPTRVLVGVSDMARLMADSDLAIGAAGATSWERCCLGLPTIMLVLADNQRQIAQNLEKAGAAIVIERCQDIAGPLFSHISGFVETPVSLLTMSQRARLIADGQGAYLISRLLEA